MTFKKGQSGNPSGPKKGWKKNIELPFTRTQVEERYYRISAILADAKNELKLGERAKLEIDLLKLEFNYLYGKPAERVEHTGQIDIAAAPAAAVYTVDEWRQAFSAMQ